MIQINKLIDKLKFKEKDVVVWLIYKYNRMLSKTVMIVYVNLMICDFYFERNHILACNSFNSSIVWNLSSLIN